MRKRQYYEMQERKKTQSLKLPPLLAWRQLKSKKEDTIGELTIKETEQYV
jgi:hypothetical protein